VDRVGSAGAAAELAQEPLCRQLCKQLNLSGRKVRCSAARKQVILGAACGLKIDAATAEMALRSVSIISIHRKRLTNTPVRMAGSVLKCPDDRKNRVVSAQATYTTGSSAVGG
jgi:hypothetical protein